MFGDQKVFRKLSPEILDLIRTEDVYFLELLEHFERHRQGKTTHAQFLDALDLMCGEVETAYSMRRDDGSDYLVKDLKEGKAS